MTQGDKDTHVSEFNTHPGKSIGSWSSKFREKKLIVCSPDCSIYQAGLLMRDQAVGSLLVVHHGEVIGIITDRDIIERGVAQNRDLKSPVRRIMTNYVVSVGIDNRMSSIIQLMVEHQISKVLIKNKSEQPVAVVSSIDILMSVLTELLDLRFEMLPFSNAMLSYDPHKRQNISK